MVSEDGSGDLSGLHWTSWGAGSAHVYVSQEVRLWDGNHLPNGMNFYFLTAEPTLSRTVATQLRSRLRPSHRERQQQPGRVLGRLALGDASLHLVTHH